MKTEMSKLYVVNFATDDFENIRAVNSKTAVRFGRANAVFEYSLKDIDDDFYNCNSEIFSFNRGAGLWLWKPYIINKSLLNINYGDYLFYSDSGVIFVNSLLKLVGFQKEVNQDIIPFELPLIEEQWTKEECFVELDCLDKKYRKTNQILATYFLIKKTKFSEKIMNEYLNCCTNIRALSSLVFNENHINSSAFISHREDQSVFSLLCKKYQIKPYREPSQFGCRPWLYSYANVIFNPIKRDGEYPLLLISVRSVSRYKVFCVKELIKCFFANFEWYKNMESKNRKKIYY